MVGQELPKCVSGLSTEVHVLACPPFLVQVASVVFDELPLVAHCDLRGLSNLLVGPDETPYVIDFVSCFFSGARWNFIRGWVFRRFCEADRQALLKLRQRVAPESMNMADAELIMHSGFFNRAMRRIGQVIRKLSLWLLTRQSGSQSGR